MKKVFIDPGHGGDDRWNVGPTGYVEADGVLKISKYLRDELLKTGAFEVKLSRDKDATVGLSARGRMAVDWKADLFISQHTNAAGIANSKARGATVYYSVDITGDKGAAAKMSAGIAAAIGTPDRGAAVRESTNYPGEDYYAAIDVPQDGGISHVFLVESAFHDNAQDEALLKVDANLKKIAVAQAKVICGIFDVQYSPLSPKSPVPTVKLTTPGNCTLIAGSSVTITGDGTNCHHIGVFINDVWKDRQDGNDLSLRYTFTSKGTYTIQLKGRNTATDKDYGTILDKSNKVTVKVLAAKTAVPTDDISKVNAAIKTLVPYVKFMEES